MPELAISGLSRATGAGERAAFFDGLNEHAAIATTLELYQSDRLLARAMERSYPPFRRDGGLDFWVWRDELELMASEGMQHVSTTLLLPGQPTKVYKTTGFLVDSGRVEIEHVAETDSLSSTDNDGNLQAHQTDLTTLAELAERARTDGSGEKNEVNINDLRMDALRGLFTVDAAAPRLTACATRQHLAAQGYGSLPLFVYDQKHGSLQPWVPSSDEVHALLQQITSPAVQAHFAASL